MMHIVACFDHGFVMPTGVMIYSACVNNADVDIVFHLVVDESVTEDDKRDLVDTITIFKGKQVRFYEISSQLCADYPLLKAERLTRATYYRLFLTQILPQTIDKVLYLDGDCIVRHSLLSLWNTNLEGYAIGVVLVKVLKTNAYFDRLKFSSSFGYFNAGVILLNLNYWRKYELLNAFVNYLNSYPERIKWEDQDVLNGVLYDKKIVVPIKYNLQTDCLYKKQLWGTWHRQYEIEEAIKDPVIIHYTFKSKPWDVYSRHPHPFRSTFLKYQNQTKWKGWLRETRPPKKILINFIGDCLSKTGLRTHRESPFIDIQPVD